jgi:membrane fusion protein (multidrug efflux system)
MKRKQILIGGAIIVALGLGIYAVVKSRGPASGPDDEAAPENVPSVVTVQLGALKQMTLHQYVSGYGTVEAAPATADQPAAGSQLAAPSAGVVARVNVIAGQQVQKGDVLVELNSGTATFDSAQAEAGRQKKLYGQQNASLKNLQDAEAQLAALQVTAPLSGTVTRLAVKPGESVDVNMPVAEVIDLSRLAVSSEIPASEATDLKTGQEVQISGTGFQPVNGQDARSNAATLSFVSPAVDAKNGTILIRALLPADSGLRPGQFVQLKIVTAVHANCLTAPAGSVVTGDSGQSVIALVNGDAAAQTPVTTGLREDGWVEVSGAALKDGASVVTVGAYGLPEKTKIRVLGAAADETAATNSTPAK